MASAAKRTCVACGQAASRRDDCVRVVLSPDGQPVIDLRAKLPGRGAWVHFRAECVRAVEKKPGKLARSLKATVPSFLFEQPLRDLLEVALANGVSQAFAGGTLVFGHDQVCSGLEARRFNSVLLSLDVAERTERHVRAAGESSVSFHSLPFSAAEFGERIGRGPVAVAGILPGSAASHLRRQLHRLGSLG